MGVRHSGVASGTTPPPTHADTLSPTRARTNRARRRAPRGLGREERASPGGNLGGHATVPWPPPPCPRPAPLWRIRPPTDTTLRTPKKRTSTGEPPPMLVSFVFLVLFFACLLLFLIYFHPTAAYHVGVFCSSRSLPFCFSFSFPSDGGPGGTQPGYPTPHAEELHLGVGVQSKARGATPRLCRGVGSPCTSPQLARVAPTRQSGAHATTTLTPHLGAAASADERGRRGPPHEFKEEYNN